MNAADIAFKTLGGHGHDLILVHGFGADRLSWAANVPSLLPLARVHSLDLPGHGGTTLGVGNGSIAFIAGAIANCIAEHGIVRAHFVGHSLGGAVALALAARRPALVASLALITPVGLGKGVSPEFLMELVEATEINATIALLRRLVVRPQLISKITANKLLEHLSRSGNRDNLRKIAGAIKIAEKTEMPGYIDAIATGLPRLVIWGSEDVINPPWKHLLAKFGAMPQFVEEAGHLPHIERPDHVNRQLVAFIGQLAAVP
jgi:pimeloyl-ACP methyl ester carboxylesterase